MRLSVLPLTLAALLIASPAAGEGAGGTRTPVPLEQGGAVLTLESALSAALERNPGFSAARNEAEASVGLLAQAGVLPNPSIDVSVDDTQKATRTTTAMLNVPVETGGKRAARVKAAELSRDMARQGVEDARAGLRAAVIAAFFDVAVAQESVRVARGTVDIAGGALRLAERRVAAGKAPPLEGSKAQVALANARIEARAAEAALLDARRKLGLLWGEAEPAFASVGGDLNALPQRAPIDELRSALAASPKMQGGKLSVDLGRAQLEVEKSKRYPDVTLSAGVARDNEAGRNKALLGVSIPLPIFDRNQGNVYAASMQAYKAQDLYRELESGLMAQLLQAVSRFDLAVGSAREYRKSVLPGATEAYEAARKGFEAGKFGFLEVLDAQRTLSDGNIAYLTVLASVYQASADIDRILGR
ncbi:Cobalt-zinc-cadmium resistance protein CzcC [Achromobacter anxifer]|jgi:cobalt-zinc-cadmium efflux system outer membrane protein|uniref:Cobalt-zinc-cadmium resistance protein CzcC n=1 Tax=Achromobacter anxifer TaxID=1287737 RepID=A0A6S7F169_9BURK|nr:TolC family protein [Achromobacter anxifer]CAB3923871.1 Cobalt-zinc-cadmium resistance protein CzcC [Achromobacter anxifer]